MTPSPTAAAPPLTPADVRRDVRTLLYSADRDALGPAIVRLERWVEESGEPREEGGSCE
jgi:hypothetical protein